MENNKLQICTYSHKINPADQTEKFHTLTDKYHHIHTRDIESVFQDNGFTNIGQSVNRSISRDGYQKHLSIWTRNDLQLGGGDRMQLLLTNSHDGASAFKIDTGVFRFICANGLVSGDLDTGFSTRHSKNALDRIDGGIKYLLERLPQVAANVDMMRNIQLEKEQIWQLAVNILNARLNKTSGPKGSISFKVRRSADRATDLWTVFNVLQENAIRGGFSYYDMESETHKTTRKISSIDRVVKLNKTIWEEAIKLAA